MNDKFKSKKQKNTRETSNVLNCFRWSKKKRNTISSGGFGSNYAESMEMNFEAQQKIMICKTENKSY